MIIKSLILVLFITAIDGSVLFGDSVGIGFEHDPPGVFAPPFVSADAPGFEFESLFPLKVGNFGSASHGQGLGILRDMADVDFLDITNILNVVVLGSSSFNWGSVSFEFGNDDPTFTHPGDLAVLRGAFGGNYVAQAVVPLNRDGVMNQTISVSAPEMARIEFGFTDSNFVPLRYPTALVETIDNVVFDLVPVAPAGVPEPSAFILLSTGVAVLGLLWQCPFPVPGCFEILLRAARRARSPS